MIFVVWPTRRCNFPFDGCWYQKLEQCAHSRTLGFEYGAAIDRKIFSNCIDKTAKHRQSKVTNVTPIPYLVGNTISDDCDNPYIRRERKKHWFFDRSVFRNLKREVPFNVTSILSLIDALSQWYIPSALSIQKFPFYHRPVRRSPENFFKVNSSITGGDF